MVVGALFLAACSGNTTAPSSSPTAPAGSSATAHTFVVSPSGRNDTARIQAAFNAAIKAGAGSTVQLAAGHFYTNSIVVKGFDGTFKGAGEGKTVIDSLRGDPKTPNAAPVTVMPGYSDPSLFIFTGGSIRVSDMSFDITARSPAFWKQDTVGTTADYLMMDVFVTSNANSDFERVGFKAAAGSDTLGYNTDEGLLIAGNGPQYVHGTSRTILVTSGTERISGCSFAGPQTGLQVTGFTRGTAAITGDVFNDAEACCVVNYPSASQIVISGNKMKARRAGNIVLWQGFQVSLGGSAPPQSLPAPHVLITHNIMSATGIAGGVYVQDDSVPAGGSPRLDATIADNTIVLANGGHEGGVDGLYAQGIKVLHNHISGTGLAAIDVGCSSFFGMAPGPASGWQIIGNDVSGVKATSEKYYGGRPTAQILLGPTADHCLVVGGGTKTTVVDQGTGNVLKNVTVER